MAIRERQGRKSPWQVYWNNPYTGKRESANFATEQEAEKYDSLVKHRLKFERESFRPEDEEENNQEITLEMAYIQCLREKQYTPEYLEYHMYAMKPVLQRFGTMPITEMNMILVNEVLEMYRRDSVRGTALRQRYMFFAWLALVR